MSVSRFTPGTAASERTRRLRKIWRAMTADERIRAIRASGPDGGTRLLLTLRAHITKALHVRPATVNGWSVSQLAEATLKSPLGEDVLGDMLIAFHLTERIPLLSAFLDAAGIPHTEGAIDAESTVELDAERVEAAADAVLADFPEHDCKIYFATLVGMEGGAWTPLESRLDESLRG